MGKESWNLETSFRRLNEIMEQMEQNELGLEQSFQLYQEGMKLIKKCNDSIDKVEKKIEILQSEK